MQDVRIKNASDNVFTFNDVSIGQYFEWLSGLFLKLKNNDDSNNAWNLSCEEFAYFGSDTKVKLVSEINIEYKL